MKFRFIKRELRDFLMRRWWQGEDSCGLKGAGLLVCLLQSFHKSEFLSKEFLLRSCVRNGDFLFYVMIRSCDIILKHSINRQERFQAIQRFTKFIYYLRCYSETEQRIETQNLDYSKEASFSHQEKGQYFRELAGDTCLLTSFVEVLQWRHCPIAKLYLCDLVNSVSKLLD